MSKRVLMQEAKNRIHVVFEREHCRSGMEQVPALSCIDEPGPLRACLDKLDHLVGLNGVKEFVKEIYAWLEINKRRRAVGLSADQQVLHMMFTGNPGTGKTTVARILAELFREMGVLSKGHLVEVERADLVGEYIGHTAQKTREHVKKALGGILFIDEAYSLARGGEKDFGKEAIDTMVKSMEDYCNDFILILAGYVEEMEHFLHTNPGLPSRFPIRLHFTDFSLDELMVIAENMLQERQYRLSLTAQEKLRHHLSKQLAVQDQPFGNARYIRNIVEQAIRNQAVRLLHMRYTSKEELMTIRGEDLRFHHHEEKQRIYSWYNEKG
ncbi:stage V sporulation protein K [Thermoflavimicrobium dichotomicum]|uniref:Stage V sporulation protein K n=1 Tax=Thermoflavimicrobium dichotomicum TaxID=46223 RepID=A0A1I3RYY5_9BACL|nr:stage V sporulation protein K [Thermoflavimicrobium dichotomicum]SFJ50559.1 stage V sporulation protein K [Thermoflavimicrobium dichotomicum]